MEEFSTQIPTKYMINKINVKQLLQFLSIEMF